MRIEEMIAAIQAQLGLDVDGKAGPQTWGAIYARIVQKKIDGQPPALAIATVDARSEKAIATLLPQVQPMARALVQKAAALGANNVLAKPFTIEKMKAAIEAVFGALK